jgi:hypothetical protein
MSTQVPERRPQLFELREPGTGRGRTVLAQNFCVQWCEGTTGYAIESRDEALLFVVDPIAVIGHIDRVAVPAKSLVILPPGRHSIEGGKEAKAIVMATDRRNMQRDAAVNGINMARDSRVVAVGQPFVRCQNESRILVYPMDDIVPPAGNPRLKIFQSSTMSVNYVEYDGPRARNALSPHAHKDFEQVTLAVQGPYVHHLREVWGPDADLWREDVHIRAEPATLLLIPPTVIHTTEGVGNEQHILLDIFAPPRRDFIAKGWVLNAEDYVDPTSA